MARSKSNKAKVQKGNNSTGGFDSSPAVNEPPVPHSTDREHVYDEVDDWDDGRVKRALSGSIVGGLHGNVPRLQATKEVLRVRVDTSDDDSDALEVESGDEAEEGSECGQLPSASAWGRKSFYNTDYQGDDGLSADEDAQLEESDAIAMQRRLAAELTDADMIDEFDEISRPSDLPTHESETVKRRMPQVRPLCEEYNSKTQLIQTVLRPIFDWHVANGRPSRPFFDHLQSVAEIYANYCVNIRYYVWYLVRVGHKQSAKHPVIERIMQWRKSCESADAVMECYADHIETILEAIQKGTNIFTMLCDAPAPIQREAEQQLEVNQQEMMIVEDETRRAIDYQIAKNRGLTPHKTKKYNKHSRVKRKRGYQQLVAKRRSQVPDVRRQTERYGGEKHGIKPHTVKSIKLKQ